MNARQLKVRKNYRLAPDVIRILTGVSKTMKRTEVSILEQLVREHCTTSKLSVLR